VASCSRLSSLWPARGAGPTLHSRRTWTWLAAQVWGSLADEESLALALKLVGGKISPSVKPGQMRILDEPVRFTVHGALTAQPVA
jgi:hypothetical protein